MTATALLDLKQRLAQLNDREREQVFTYLQRLKHESPSGKRETTRIMREMDAGKKTRLTDLAKKLGHA